MGGVREMVKPPAEVSFPGDKNRRKKVRMRGIKKASKAVSYTHLTLPTTPYV